MQVRKTQVTEGGLRKYGKWKYKPHQIRIRGKRKYGKQKYESAKGENASMENTSTNLRGGNTSSLRKRETRLLCVSICMSDLKLTLHIS